MCVLKRIGFRYIDVGANAVRWPDSIRPTTIGRGVVTKLPASMLIMDPLDCAAAGALRRIIVSFV